MFPNNKTKSGHFEGINHIYPTISKAAETKFWFHALRNNFITIAEREIGLATSLTKRLVNHARPQDVTEGYLPISNGGGNLFFQLVNARYEKSAMILTSNRGFAEWAEVFGDPVMATALLDRLLHHAVFVQIEGASYRLRAHTDLVPEHVRANAPITPPPPPKQRGRPRKG